MCVPSESKLQHLSITPLAMSTSSESRLLENVFFIQKGRDPVVQRILFGDVYVGC
jgi:hypothetical protein